MSTQHTKTFDPAEMIRLYAGISRKSRELLRHSLQRKAHGAGTPRAFSAAISAKPASARIAGAIQTAPIGFPEE